VEEERVESGAGLKKTKTKNGEAETGRAQPFALAWRAEDKQEAPPGSGRQVTQVGTAGDGATAETKTAHVCFGCGKDNAGGMHLEFVRDEAAKRVIGEFALDERYQGAPGMAHGGVVAVVLDEALSKVSKFYGASAVTAMLNVEYLRPVRVGEKIRVEGWNERVEGRQLYHAGEIRDEKGRVLARAQGRFVAIDPERFRNAMAVSTSGGSADSKENGQ